MVFHVENISPDYINSKFNLLGLPSIPKDILAAQFLDISQSNSLESRFAVNDRSASVGLWSTEEKNSFEKFAGHIYDQVCALKKVDSIPT